MVNVPYREFDIEIKKLELRIQEQEKQVQELDQALTGLLELILRNGLPGLDNTASWMRTHVKLGPYYKRKITNVNN